MKRLQEIILPVINAAPGRAEDSGSKRTVGGLEGPLFIGAGAGVRQKADRHHCDRRNCRDCLARTWRFFCRNCRRRRGAEALQILAFPGWGVLPFEADSPDSRTIGERMRFLYSLISGNPGIFVVPAPSLLQKLPPWELFADSVKTITMATTVDPDEFTALLVSIGYESSSLVTRVGEFSRRGGIIDFFSPLHE